MAQRIEAFVVTIPAQTPTSAPLDTPTIFAPGDVQIVEIRIPAGHVGLTGFQILEAGTAIIPSDGSVFIITDNEVIHWSLEGFPNHGDFALRAYNTDVNPHSFHLRYLVNELIAPGNEFRIVTPLPIVA